MHTTLALGVYGPTSLPNKQWNEIRIM